MDKTPEQIAAGFGQDVDLVETGQPMFIKVAGREIAVMDAVAFRAMQDAALSARPAGDYALVPVEPTEAMLEAVAPFPEHLFADGKRSADDRKAMEVAAMVDRAAFVTQYRKAIAARPDHLEDDLNMVERVARAMAKLSGVDPDDTHEGVAMWKNWEDEARAAIAAITGEGA